MKTRFTVILVVCLAGVALAQLQGGSILDVPRDLSISDAVLKVATWIMAVLIFVTARYADKIPLLKKIPSKYFSVISIALAIGYTFIKLGYANGTEAVIALIGSNTFHEILKSFTSRNNIPSPTPEFLPQSTLHAKEPQKTKRRVKK